VHGKSGAPQPGAAVVYVAAARKFLLRRPFPTGKIRLARTDRYGVAVLREAPISAKPALGCV